MKIVRIVLFLFLTSIFFLCYPQVAYGKIFQDNFDQNSEGSFPQGWVLVNDPDRTPCNATWNTHNGKVGIVINQDSCTTNIMPSDQIWDNLGDNYTLEVDMTFDSGTDHNVAFRFSPSTPSNNWYDIHFQSPGDFVLERVEGTYNINISKNYPNLNTYHVKITIDHMNIKVYIDNSLVRDFTMSTDYFPTGRVALRAGTGGDTNSETWFDNVVVTSLDGATPTPTPPTPIVFLPGLGGSINFKEMFLGTSDTGGWRMTPGAKVYDNLLKAFEGNPDFHIFYYDWRKPVSETAQKLNDYIQNTVNPWNNKVDIVGHSLGGLVARTCVQITANNCYADKLITVGSPNFGAVDAYPALEGGEIWRTGPSKLGFELLLHYFQQPGETKRETLLRIAPVLNDLLPNFDYLIKNGTNLPPSALSLQNLLLPELSDLSPLENLTKTLTGRGFSSIEQIILTEPNWVDKLLGNWPDGKPIDKLLTLEGDNSVLTKSSSFSGSLIENFTYNLDHGGIISEHVPLTKIMEILGLELNPGTYDSLEDEENFLIFFVHSPVKISSPDVTPNSYTTDELIIIPSPENKDYVLNVEGIESDYYSLSIGQIFGEKVIWNDYFDETYNGKNQSFNFSINQDYPSENPLLDPNGKIVTNQLTSRIKEFKKEVQDLKIRQIFKNILLGLLYKIQNTTKNPEMSFLSLALLRQTIAGYEKGGVISQETATVFRKKSTGIANSLEYLCFFKPQKINKFQSQTFIKSTEKTRNSVNQKKLTRNGALVFTEAQEKLDKASLAFGKSEYYRAKIFALEASQLFLESRMIK